MTGLTTLGGLAVAAGAFLLSLLVQNPAGCPEDTLDDNPFGRQKAASDSCKASCMAQCQNYRGPDPRDRWEEPLGELKCETICGGVCSGAYKSGGICAFMAKYCRQLGPSRAQEVCKLMLWIQCGGPDPKK